MNRGFFDHYMWELWQSICWQLSGWLVAIRDCSIEITREKGWFWSYWTKAGIRKLVSSSYTFFSVFHRIMYWKSQVSFCYFFWREGSTLSNRHLQKHKNYMKLISPIWQSSSLFPRVQVCFSGFINIIKNRFQKRKLPSYLDVYVFPFLGFPFLLKCIAYL